MNIQSNSYKNTICIKQLESINYKNKGEELLQIVVEPYTGSNGYVVGIYSSSLFNSVIAKVLDLEGKQILLSQSKIVNGLTGQSINNEQIMGIMQRPSGSFRAVYLPQSGKVYIWPHMAAAGQEHFRTTYLVTDSN